MGKRRFMGKRLQRPSAPVLEQLESREMLSLSPFRSLTLQGDYIASGVGLRGQSAGTVTVSGIPEGAHVAAAYLYYGYLAQGEAADLGSIGFAGVRVAAELTGSGPDTNWGGVDRSYGYRADVTAHVNGNGAYRVSDVVSRGGVLAQGASLVIVYESPSLPVKTVSLFDGNDVLTDSQREPLRNNFGGLLATTGATARTTFVVGDGQASSGGYQERVRLTAGGEPIVLDNRFVGGDGNFWDTLTTGFSSAAGPGPVAIEAEMSWQGISGGEDALMWVAQVVSIDTPAQPEGPLRVTSAAPAPGSQADGGARPIVLGFSQPIDEATRWPGAFALVGSGPDGAFDGADDVPFPIQAVSWDATARTLALDPGLPLPRGGYRLVASDILQSVGGRRLDGDGHGALPSGNGSDGGPFAMEFRVANNSPAASSATSAAVGGVPTPIQLAATDADGDPLSYRIVRQPAHGTLAPGAGAGAWIYTPTPGYGGPDSFTFAAGDGTSESAPSTFSLSVAPQPSNLAPTSLLLPDFVSLAPGLSTRLTWSAQNMGPGVTPESSYGWTDRVFLSRDGVLGPNDVLLTSSRIARAPVPAGGGYTAAADIVVPSSVGFAGDAFLIVEIDSFAASRDADPSNNRLAVPVRVVPSIALDGPYQGQFVDARSPLRFNYRDSIGHGAAMVSFVLDTDGVPGNGLGERVLQSGVVDDPASPTGSASASLPALAPGTYHVWAVLESSFGTVRSEPVAVRMFEEVYTSATGDGPLVGGGGYTVHGVEFGRVGGTIDYRVRTNYTGGGPGDLYINIGGSYQTGTGRLVGLSLRDRQLPSGQAVEAGSLYLGATFARGTSVSSHPTMLTAYTRQVDDESTAVVTDLEEAGWDREITGTFDVSALGLEEAETIQLSYSMYCGNDIKDVVSGPIEPREDEEEEETDDLAITSASLAEDRSSVTYGYSVTGEPRSFVVGFYLSGDDKFDPSDRQISSESVDLGPDGAISGSRTYQLGQALQPDATHPYLLVVIDPDDTVDESDETNNWAHALVGPEDLDIDPVPATIADVDGDGEIEFALDRDHDGRVDAVDLFTDRSEVKFLGVDVKLPAGADPSVAKIRLNYRGSDHWLFQTTMVMEMGFYGHYERPQYSLPHAPFRLWATDADQRRSIPAAGSPGDYLPAGEAIPISRLLDGGTTARFYVEGLFPSTRKNDQQNKNDSGDQDDSTIRVEIDPDGDGPLGWISTQIFRTIVTPSALPTYSAPSSGQLNNGAWRADWSISANDGLVVENVMLVERYMARMMSLPYGRISAGGVDQRFELSPSGAAGPGGLRSRLIDFDVKQNGDAARVSVAYVVENIKADSITSLIVTQDYEFRSPVQGDPGEPTSQSLIARYFPSTGYLYFGQQGDQLNRVSLPQRLHLTAEGISIQAGSLLHDDVFPVPIFDSVVDAPFGNPMGSERSEWGIVRGANGPVDNYHQTWNAFVQLPRNFFEDADTLKPQPGEPNAGHIHWSWTALAGALHHLSVAAFLGIYNDAILPAFPQNYLGNPLIREGSTQSLRTGVTRLVGGDTDPADWERLVDGERLIDGYGRPDTDVVFWYEGQGFDPWDVFFKHGGFFKAELDGWVTPLVEASAVPGPPAANGQGVSRTLSLTNRSLSTIEGNLYVVAIAPGTVVGIISGEPRLIRPASPILNPDLVLQRGTNFYYVKRVDLGMTGRFRPGAQATVDLIFRTDPSQLPYSLEFYSGVADTMPTNPYLSANLGDRLATRAEFRAGARAALASGDRVALAALRQSYQETARQLAYQGLQGREISRQILANQLGADRPDQDIRPTIQASLRSLRFNYQTARRSAILARDPAALRSANQAFQAAVRRLTATRPTANA